MQANERLTHVRASGMKGGYWTPHKKEELVERLGKYEDTGLLPEEIKAMESGPKLIPEEEFKEYLADLKEMIVTWRKEGLSYLSHRLQLVDVILNVEDATFTTEQLKQMFALTK